MKRARGGAPAIAVLGVFGVVTASAPAIAALPARHTISHRLSGAAPEVLIGPDSNNSSKYWKVQPSQILLFRSLNISSIRWSRWDSGKAVGRGNLSVLDCTPSCADGHYRPRGTGRLVLSRVSNGRYTRLRLRQLTSSGTQYYNGTYRTVRTGYWNWARI